MNSVFLIRHGDYDNPRKILPGRLPVELSEKGKSQAQKLAKFFDDKNITKIYSSAVLRCKQTSEIISGGKIGISYDKRLLETFSAYQGYWGKNWNGDGYHFYSHRTELGGESIDDIKKRMSEFWQETTKNLEGNLIIVSHADPLQTLYSYIYKVPTNSETVQENKIPGWIETGEFIEVKLENGNLVDA